MKLIRVTIDLLNANEKPIIEEFDVVSETQTAYIYLSDGLSYSRPREVRRRVDKRDIAVVRGRRSGLLTMCYWFVADIGDSVAVLDTPEFHIAMKKIEKRLSADLRCYKKRLAGVMEYYADSPVDGTDKKD